MPGSGKSTVGRHVARHLGLPFFDSDHVIEQRIGCSIRAPEDLARRLRHDTHRPLLQGSTDPLKRLRTLYQERDPLYRRCAHYVIETGRPSVHTLVSMVLMQIELAGLLPEAAKAPPPHP